MTLYMNDYTQVRYMEIITAHTKLLRNNKKMMELEREIS